MGSWSVSCGISNIAITSGKKCVLLPLKTNDNHSYEYSSHLPATLPIFGEYNDYGGIEEIEKTTNTKLISEHFGISIDEFCEFLVDGKFTYDRSELKPIIKKLKKHGSYEEIQQWRFMWIDRQVWDFMTVCGDSYHKGYMDYGTTKFLTLFGFEKVDEVASNYDPKRFNQVWRKGNLRVYSDGRSLLSTSSNYMYHFGKGDESSIETYFDVPEELHFLKGLSRTEAWRYMEPLTAKEVLGGIIGNRWDLIQMEELLEQLGKEKLVGDDTQIPTLKKPKSLSVKYIDDLETYGDELAKLINVHSNLNCMSGDFSPHKLYLTPQCGEREAHQILLEKFAEINKSYISEYDKE
jgi:hypothetical protein